MNKENHYADKYSLFTDEWFITHTLCGCKLDQPLDDQNLVVPGYNEKEATCDTCVLIAFAEPARIFDQEERLFRDVIIRHYYNFALKLPLEQIE